MIKIQTNFTGLRSLRTAGKNRLLLTSGAAGARSRGGFCGVRGLLKKKKKAEAQTQVS